MGILTKQFIEKEIKELRKDKAYRDSDGLYLLARPKGNHSWYYRFTYNSTRDKITLGQYKWTYQ